MRAFRRLACAAALLAVAAAPAYAQFGRVAGTVKDDAGRAIRGATIVASNPAMAPATLTASTDQKGRFAILGLRRGVWTFTIEAPGFERLATTAEVSVIKPNPPLEVRLAAAREPAPRGALANVDARELQQRLDAAEALALRGELDAAIAAYREIHVRVPALTSVLLQVGALCERKQDSAAALGAYQQVLASDPTNARARAAIERLTRSR